MPIIDMPVQIGSLPEPAVHLLAVVEVNREDRILCQAIGCGHSIFKRVHIMKVGNSFKVLGSQCFKRLYGHLDRSASTPIYGSSDGMRLTDDERLILFDNTERFIAKLEAARLEVELADVQRREVEQERLTKLTALNMDRIRDPHILSVSQTYKTSQHLTFDDSAAMRWMWTRSLVEGRSRIEQYISGDKRTREKDLIVRYFGGGSRSDPWAFSLNLKHHHLIPMEITLSILHEFALIELPPAYV